MKTGLFAESGVSDSDTSSSSSSESTLASVDNENVKAIAKLYENVQPRAALSVHDRALGLSKRTVDRFTEAFARTKGALLQKHWAKLQTALKQLDAATQAFGSGNVLGYRLPLIGARLVLVLKILNP